MNNHFFNKLRDWKRKWDIGDFNHGNGNTFTKKTHMKRVRQLLKKEQAKEIKDIM